MFSEDLSETGGESLNTLTQVVEENDKAGACILSLNVGHQ